MKKKVFFLFPGQGAQYPGMGLDLLEQAQQFGCLEKLKILFSLASEITGKDMAGLIGNSSPEILKRTDISQPTITLVNLAAMTCLKEIGITPSGCAGFSLGEYSALAAAGVISEEDCLYLVNKRGIAMQAAIDRIPPGPSAPGMAAVIGLAPERVEALIKEWKEGGLSDLNAANINSPRQVVVSGSSSALEEAEKRFKEAGARRFMRLQVAGPYHSPFMTEAAQDFYTDLEYVEFKDPVIPLFSNVSGKQISGREETKTLARMQMLEGVRWTDEEAAISMLEPELLLEAGPGKVLQGLWKETGSAIPCYGAGTAEEIKSLTEKI